MVSGLVHSVTAYAPLPEALAWLLGGGAVLAAGVLAVRATRHINRRAWFPILWTLLACLPLPAAGWVVGARYFYLPAVGLMLMLALAADTRGAAATIAAISLLAAIGLGSTATRVGEVRRYRAVLAAAHDAVAQGVQAGHTIFLVRNAVKDLDLALKLGWHNGATTAAGDPRRARLVRLDARRAGRARGFPAGKTALAADG